MVAVDAADQRRHVGPGVVVARCRVVDVHLLDGAAVVRATVAPALVGAPVPAVEQRRPGRTVRESPSSSGPWVRDHVRVGLKRAGVDELEGEPLRARAADDDLDPVGLAHPEQLGPVDSVSFAAGGVGKVGQRGERPPERPVALGPATDPQRRGIVAVPRQRHHPVRRRAQPRGTEPSGVGDARQSPRPRRYEAARTTEPGSPTSRTRSGAGARPGGGAASAGMAPPTGTITARTNSWARGER